MLDVVARHAAKNFYQISQSKSKVVVFGDESECTNNESTMWEVHGMYNDDKNGIPDHIEELEKYQYLGTWFHRDRTWDTQFQESAKKFWTRTADKWMESGAVRMGAGELVTNTLWNTLAAPALDYDPLVTLAAHANSTTIKALKPLNAVTKAARQASTGGREHCSSAARMATGILDAEARRTVRCATAVARIMKAKGNGIQKRVLRHIARGTAGCRRTKEALSSIARKTGTAGVIAGWRKPTSVNAKNARKVYVAIEDVKATRAAAEHSHVKESLELYQAIRKTHGVTTLPRKILRGDYLGQLTHQQIRAAATRFNAYTGRHGRNCTHAQCAGKRETSRHAVVECKRYATARLQFTLETGVEISVANYIDIMALNAKKLAVQPEVLSKALCRLLAHITKKHRRENNVSVATTLGNSNQRRSIIRTDQSEQPPD